MLQPNIAQCYGEIVKDPSLLQLFLEQECTSLQELPLLGLSLEMLFTCIASPDIWGKTGVEFITDTSQTVSREANPTVILITSGVGEENLGMMTVFCYHDQNKMEAIYALSALCQCDSPEPSVVVVRRYTNIPYIPQGTSWLLYLNVSTLSRGTSSIQFPLDHLCLQSLLPYS